MLKINYWSHQKVHIRSILPYATSCTLFALLAAIFLLPGSVFAQTTGQTSTTLNAAAGPTFSVNAGFNTRYRSGNWIPVQVALNNDGADFTGTISITTINTDPYSNTGAQSSYQTPISLANGAQKQVTLYVPIYTSAQSITVSLLNADGNTVRTQSSVLQPLNPGDIFVGILSDSSTGFGPLNGFTLPNAGSLLITDNLTASTLPDEAPALKNFNIIVLDNFTTSTLSTAQLAALQSWVNGGGALIVAGGPEWQRTLATLPSGLLPVIVNGTGTLRAGTPLLPVGSPSAQTSSGAPAPVPISKANATVGSETILSSGSTPLIVQANFGQGSVHYLAFDPILKPIVDWSDASALWKGLVLRALGDGVLANSYTTPFNSAGQTAPFTGLLQLLLPNTLPSPWILALLLIGYILILGPVRMIILRWRKRRDWSWRIVLSTIVVFSLASYGLAVQEKGTTIISNRITLLRLSQHGSLASVTTYLGIFVPNQGDYRVSIAGDGLVQPSPDGYNSFGSSGFNNGNVTQKTTITPGQNGTDVNLQGVAIWTLRSLLAQQNTQVQGGILSSLTLRNGTLSGTVTNTLATALSDVYVLMPNSYVNIGNLGAGETKLVHLSLNTPSTTSTIPLAAQIASANGMPGYYYDSSSVQTERQRHIAIMSAVDGISSTYACSGSGGPCAVTIVQSGGFPSYGAGMVAPGAGPVAASSGISDPLLIAGAPATLIGWANSPQVSNAGNNITIDGASTTGIDETMIQAPLDVNYSGSLNLPPQLLNGQLVDVEGNTVQTTAPGIYSLTTGSMTFEFVIPDAAHLRSGSLTMTEPANITSIASPGGSPVNDGSQQALLYNWQTRTWDSIAFSLQEFSTANMGAYIGPSGRVLVQFGNENTSSGTTVFGKPSLNISGVIAQ